MKKTFKIQSKLTSIILVFTLLMSAITIPALAKIEKRAKGEELPYIIGEIESMRTETEKFFKMSDGKMQMAIYNSPVHFENKSGKWEEINNNLKSKDNDTYTTKNTSQDISLSKKYKKGKTIEIASDDCNISWGFIGTNNSEAEIVEKETEDLKGDKKFTTVPNAVSTTIYKDIYNNIDAEYIITGGQVKENLIISEETDQNEFKIEYRYKKLSPIQIDDKTIELQNSKGKTVYKITAPIMTDDNGAFSDELKLEIVSDKNNKLTVKLITDKEWLQDNDRDYPVTIDPSVEYTHNEAYYGFSCAANYEIPEYGAGNYYIACNETERKSAIIATFQHIPTLSKGSYITNAEFHIPRITVSGNLNIFCLGESAPYPNYSWEQVSDSIENKYPDAVYVTDGSNDAYWNITRTYQQYYKNDIPFSYAITSTTGYAEMIIDKTFSYITTPVLSLTYSNQFGIQDKYSYHEFDVSDAGSVYLNDLTGSYILKREDASIKTSNGTVNLGMYYRNSVEQYTWDFKNHYYSWNAMYHEKIIKETNYLTLRKDDGSIYYYDYPPENDTNYYSDIDNYGSLKLSVVGENSFKVLDEVNDVIYEYSSYGYNEFNNNDEVYLTKIYLSNSETPFLSIEYNDLTEEDLDYLFEDLRNIDSESKTISKITDEDGNIYNFAYHSDYALLLTSITCLEQNIDLNYTYNSNRWLNSVRKNKINVATYKYMDFNTSYRGTQYLSEIIDVEDYKIKFEVNAGRVSLIEEYGYDFNNESWVLGSRLGVERFPYCNVYNQLDIEGNIEYSESYYFDKNGYLASVSNGDGYAINQNADQEGNVFANTEITIPVVNLLNDSSFEKSTSVWSLTNAYVQTKSESVNNAYFGNKWLEINNTSFSTAKASQTVTGLSAGTYTFSAYVKAAENSTIELNENNTIYDGVSIRASIGNTTKKATGISGEHGDWTRVYVTFDVTTANSPVDLELGLYNAKGKIYVDAVQLENHKRAYDYNAIENADFSNNSVWTINGDAEYSKNPSKRGSLDNNVLKIENGYAEQEIYLSNVNNASVSAWISTIGMIPSNETSRISIIGLNDNTETSIVTKNIDYCIDSNGSNENNFYKIMMPIESTVNYENYKIRIEYSCPQGYLYVDGVEVMSGVMNVTGDENNTTDNENGLETVEQDDYQIENGYTIVSTINSFNSYTGNADCSYLVNGTVVNTTNEEGEIVKDETASTAYLGNSWGVTQNKDKYEYTDSTGATKTTGGIWIGGKLDKTTQSGIRFWYKSNASWMVQLRSSTYGKGGTYDYAKTLPAAPKGTWVTLLYKNIETSNRKITDFKYLFVKASSAPVYVDEVQTVLQDSVIYKDVEYSIADITQEENNNYPVIDEYVYDETINTFNNYTGEFGYLVNGTESSGTAYSGNSWGVTQNIDKYVYTDENNNSYWSYGIVVGSFDSSKDGIRFWYKSSKECDVSLRKQFYGISETDYVKTLPAAPNGDWCTILYEDIENANKDLSIFYCIFVKTKSAPSVYIDELHYVIKSEDNYSVTENYEESRDGQVMKTVSSSKSLTINNKLCTINRETNSLGIDTFTTTEDETGNQISATDGNGNTVNYSYDELNKLIEMSQTVNGQKQGIKYSYNVKGQVQTIETENVIYTYWYTPFGDLEAITIGDTVLVSYTYVSNQNRNISEVKYSNSQTINYIYDSNKTLIKVIYKGSAGNVTNTITYTNDEKGNVIKTENDNDDTITLEYLGEKQIWDITETNLLYSYLSDEKKLVENNDGYDFITTFSSTDNIDKSNVLITTESTSFGDNIKTVYTDAFGRTVKEETKSGNTIVIVKEYEYTSNGEYTTDQVKSVTTTIGNGIPETVRYTYDRNENITEIYSKRGNDEETTIAIYEYDQFNQLIKENDKIYTYDLCGNILTAGEYTYSYNNSQWKDQLTSFNDEDIDYNSLGNPTLYFNASLEWNSNRQLESYSTGNQYINYYYNTSGLRSKKAISNFNTVTAYKYYWNESNLTHQTWGNKYLHFYYDNCDNIFGFSYFDGTTSSDYLYIKNIQGDILGIINEDGVLVATYTYDAWGNILTSNGVMSNINPIRYRGYYYDDETGLYYLQNRYYDSTIGRFISANSFVENIASNKISINSTNLYLYCENNTLFYSSISGKTTERIKKRISVIMTEADAKNPMVINFMNELKNIFRTEILQRVVYNSDEFRNAWNSFPDSDCVFILSHGSDEFLQDDYGTNLLDLTNYNELNFKDHTSLFLLACSTADQSKRSFNIAYCLKTKISGVVFASDSVVTYYGNSSVSNFGALLVDDNGLKYKGWVLYQNNSMQNTDISLPHGDDTPTSILYILNYLIKNNFLKLHL